MVTICFSIQTGSEGAIDGKFSGHSLFVGFGWFSGDEGRFQRGVIFFFFLPSGKVSVIIRIFFNLIDDF